MKKVQKRNLSLIRGSVKAAKRAAYEPLLFHVSHSTPLKAPRDGAHANTTCSMLHQLLFIGCACSLLLASLSDASAACTDPDCFAPVPQLILEKGYPVESHDVVTSDDYILTMHRIPRPGAPAVLLQHGLLDASETWVTQLHCD